MKRMMTIQINLGGCNHGSLIDKNDCKVFLKDLVDKVGMKIIPESSIGSQNPISFFFDKDVLEQEFGVTGVVILYESHASFHAWPYLNNFVCVTITSCKPFDPEEVVRWVKEYLKAMTVTYETILL